MLLTWATVSMGIIGAVLQVIAHVLMWEDGKVERVPVARYAVGLGIVGLCFSTGWLIDDRQHPIAAFWYVALLSGFTVGACYEWRRRHPKEVKPIAMTRDGLELWADAIAGEHDDAA